MLKDVYRKRDTDVGETAGLLQEVRRCHQEENPWLHHC